MSSILLTDGLTDAQAAWLSANLSEAEPPFSFERITGGYSMLTYRVSDSAGNAWVLRHPPAGQGGGRAHDTDREARLMSALQNSDVPVPRLRAVGAPDGPFGTKCHITDFVTGYVLADADAAIRYLTPEARREASADIVRTLAAIHAVAPDDVGLGDLGPRTNYVARQLHRWRSVVEQAASPSTAALASDLIGVANALELKLPPDVEPRIVHGDFKLGNVIVDEDGRVRAVLDWELATLGDPLSDLGMLSVFWDPPARAMLGVKMPTSAPGSLDAQAAVHLYMSLTGANVEDFWFYEALSSWRLACTGFRAYARYASGAMQDDTDISQFADACGDWIAIARDKLAV